MENFTQLFFQKNLQNEEGEWLRKRKCFKWLNLDNLDGIIADETSKTFYIELVSSYSTLPKYAINEIKKFMSKFGYTYQYDN